MSGKKKYEPKHFPNSDEFNSADDRDRIATALERIADALEKATKEEEDKNGPAVRGFGRD